MGLKTWLWSRVTRWLTTEHAATTIPLCDFDRVRFEIRPCDVLLVEGRSRVSDIIKLITQSPWTHSALYLGRIHDIQDPALRERVVAAYKGDPNDQLLIESLLGSGTIISPLHKYANFHIRVCRPRGLSCEDTHHVVRHVLEHLGVGYDVRQLLDLARFMFPYGILPRRWRSSLFEHNAGAPTRTVCSSMLATAFAAVQFPILPVMQRDAGGRLRMYRRNFRLYTPRDFDYSPYFDIIKYPFFGHEDLSYYRRLPWDEEGVTCNDDTDCFVPQLRSQIAAPHGPTARRRSGDATVQPTAPPGPFTTVKQSGNKA